jgi:hypothetical protein
MEKDMLFQVMDNIAKNGSEFIHTERNTYEVKGILFGDMSDQIIYT